MLTIKISWWLWNQMFQYAYIRSLSLKNNSDFKLDISEYDIYFRPYELEIFDIQKKYAVGAEIPFYEKIYSKNRYIGFALNKFKGILKKLNKNHFSEIQFNFDRKMSVLNSWYIEWYFQTEKYFLDHENEIRKDFTFIKGIAWNNKKYSDMIKDSNSVSIHIRRWDYVANSRYSKCSLDYYNSAIEYIKWKVENPIFFIFSDDMEWTKANLNIDNEVHFIDFNSWKSSWGDMRLMSLCKHNIIANSSFSWWWAWLNANPTKMIIWPKKWFNDNTFNTCDILPNTWIKM